MKHLFKFVELFAAIVLSAVLFPIALIYNIIMNFTKLPYFLVLFIIEIYKLIFDSFEKIAIIIDRLGNVVLANMFINLFIFKEHRNRTLFYKSEKTISAAFGHAFKHGYLKRRGLFFVSFLDKIFGKEHCIKAHEFDLLKELFNQKTGIS